MRLAVLFSGGKDSCLAMHKAMQEHEVVCLITVISKNPESYMFHTPNIHLTRMQAEAIGLPLIQQETLGEKEKELDDLRKAIIEAKERFQIEGIVTGAIRSEYQASRIQRICDELGLQCINPLWHMDQVEVLKEVVSSGFKTIISGVFAYPLDESFLGKEIDDGLISKLIEVNKKIELNVAGEGGEIETTVLDGPMFRKRLKVKNTKISFSNNSGTYEIEADID
ncbi:MAG: TIGR00289 family protein [Nanoarchaeota archaeon]|nr:TIGR00289 family protein [Nanoarchaeota archaeon]